LKERENINNALRGIHNDEGFCKKVHLWHACSIFNHGVMQC